MPNGRFSSLCAHISRDTFTSCASVSLLYLAASLRAICIFHWSDACALPFSHTLMWKSTRIVDWNSPDLADLEAFDRVIIELTYDSVCVINSRDAWSTYRSDNGRLAAAIIIALTIISLVWLYDRELLWYNVRTNCQSIVARVTI